MNLVYNRLYWLIMVVINVGLAALWHHLRHYNMQLYWSMFMITFSMIGLGFAIQHHMKVPK